MKKLAQAALAIDAGTLLYTVPNTCHTEVLCIDIANTTADPLACTIHLVPKGGAPAAANMLFPAVVIAAKTLREWRGTQALNQGDFIQGIGSAAGLTANITGIESLLGR